MASAWEREMNWRHEWWARDEREMDYYHEERRRQERDYYHRIQQQMYDSLITPTFIREETKPVSEASKKLDQVKSEIANLEGKLNTAECTIVARNNEIAALKNAAAVRRNPDRALYIGLDGTTKVEDAQNNGSGPAREVRKVETRLRSMRVRDYNDNIGPSPIWERRYHYTFSQGSLHVYQEV